MKKLLTIALVLFTTATFAQIDRSKLPTPAPAREIEIGDYEQFTLKNGLKVIVVENDKLPTLSWILTMDNGLITEGDKSGYVGMVGPVLRAGTTSKTKEVLDEEIDFMGASISVGSSSISGFSLSKYKEQVLELMTDILYNPAFPQSELDKNISQTKTGLLQGRDDPGTISAVVSSVLNYGKDHVFGEITTEETLDNITMDDIRKHYETYFKPNIAYLVIVGDIKKKEARKLARKYFDKWEKAEVPRESFTVPKPIEETKVAIIDRPSSVQSVINITYTIDNKPGSADQEKISLLNQILGGAGLSTRLNMNLREDKGYTYGANSDIGSSRYSASVDIGASVRNEVTDSAMVQFLYEINLLREELVTEEELDLAKNTMRGDFARSLESRATVAQFALSAQLNNLPDDYFANYLKRVDAITAEDIRETARKYLTPDKANIVVVGKAEDIAEKLRQFGEVKFYDADGNEVDDPTKVEIDANITAKSILDKYIDAIGGAEKLKTVTTLVNMSEANLSLGGQTFNIKRAVHFKGPDSYADVQSIPVQGDIVQVYHNGSAFVKAGGQKQPLPPQLAVLYKYMGTLFGERFYEEIGFKTTYKGMAKFNGADVHRIEIDLGEGTTINEYYDVESGFKVKVEMGPAVGTFEFSDYKEVEGIMIPFKFAQSGGQLPTKLEFLTSEVKLNEEIDDAKFN